MIGFLTPYGAVMLRSARVRFVLGVLVAVLGLAVAVCGYENVSYFADLGVVARRLGDDGTGASFVSFVAGILLLALGVISAAAATPPTGRASAF